MSSPSAAGRPDSRSPDSSAPDIPSPDSGTAGSSSAVSGSPGGSAPHAGAPHAGARPRRPVVRPPREQDVFSRMRTSQDRVADAITAFAGTMRFVYLHAVWFAVWIALNEGLLGKAGVFDPYPFGLLTMIVSLEAIFLSTFVMVSQNRQAARDNVRADLDFETNLRSEIWSVHIGKALGLDPEQIERHVQEIVAQSRAGLESASHGAPVDPRSL